MSNCIRKYVKMHSLLFVMRGLTLSASAINRRSAFVPKFKAQNANSLSLAEAAEWIARSTGSPKPHISTVNRWATHGVRGVRLQTTRVGAKFWTTAACIDIDRICGGFE
jgi:hypothetical protein